ncbi:hypothetical protein CNR22_00720 [Sphingobacteriaceae bacterium]|nr:hypothetical protein CNR22_00720 [Sphingobacteriaceae bacterium]
MTEFNSVIAEDDEDDFFSVKEIFNEVINHPITRVNDGIELVDYLQASEYEPNGLQNQVLLDINMPRMDGIQALEKIEASFGLKVPVIMYSTSSDSEQMEKCKRLGAIGFVKKGSGHNKIMDFVLKTDKALEELKMEPSKLLFIR